MVVAWLGRFTCASLQGQTCNIKITYTLLQSFRVRTANLSYNTMNLQVGLTV